MGLDMYLDRRIRIGANYEHNKITGSIDLKKDGKPFQITLNKVSEITERAGYWRKANHIHAWFVKHVQEGVDNCGEYWVSKEDFTKLLIDCKAIKENKDKAPELMPTKSGFFFGGTEYDEHYFNDIDETIEICQEALKDLEENGSLSGDYYYTSSW
jgi:hypothetical protein